MFTEEHLYSIALRKCRFIGDITFSKLLEYEGTAENVWKAKKNLLSKIEGIGPRILSEIGNLELLQFAENELKYCEKNVISILLKKDSEYPFLLSQCEDSPSVLYYKGVIPAQHKSISIVGTRNITDYGKFFLESLFEELKKYRISTVSGLALGVDTKVHQLSLKENIPTLAVLAHGFNTIYPNHNKSLSEEIVITNGALITEFHSSQKPDKEHFIQRNRIIAGFSQSTLIIETAYGGGSISTANFANNYNREIFALPGKINDKYSQGCNQLISQNKARIIYNINQLIDELEIQTDLTGNIFERPITTKLSKNQELIYHCLIQNSILHLDDIVNQLNFSRDEILSILLELELDGLIKTLPGKKYQAI